jgi:hypothetical protein
MSDRAIVLDANILIRAVLGKRVRELLVDNAERVQFFSPDVAYADARKYLPALLKKEALTVSQRWTFWMPSNPSSGLWSLAFMRASKRRHTKELRCVMRMIGPFWLAP